jgi:hypothetical protein
VPEQRGLCSSGAEHPSTTSAEDDGEQPTLTSAPAAMLIVNPLAVPPWPIREPFRTGDAL